MVLCITSECWITVKISDVRTKAVGGRLYYIREAARGSNRDSGTIRGRGASTNTGGKAVLASP